MAMNPLVCGCGLIKHNMHQSGQTATPNSQMAYNLRSASPQGAMTTEAPAQQGLLLHQPNVWVGIGAVGLRHRGSVRSRSS